MTSPESFSRAFAKLDHISPTAIRGYVTELVGMVLKATLPGIHVGEYVHIYRNSEDTDPIGAEVIGFSHKQALLMAYGFPTGIGPESRVESRGSPLAIHCGMGLLGRILNGLGHPIDGRPEAQGLEAWCIHRAPPHPLERPRIRIPMTLGVRAIDALLTVGEGQRIGLFAGSGVGKSTLLGQLTRNASADVVVVCLIGERGREVREFLEDSLGEGLARSVVVCSTSDEPPLMRLKAAEVATAIAEYFRESGNRVLLLMDSVTRYARALREVALAAGEPPARRGFPPSVFALLPRLLERTGTSFKGSITAIYTILVEGDDFEEPVADEMRGFLDGHFVLSRELSQRGHFPAIDILQSLSRLMPSLTDSHHQHAAIRLRQLLTAYERQKELILLGAYQTGTDKDTDEAVLKLHLIQSFLKQGKDEVSSFSDAVQALQQLVVP